MNNVIKRNHILTLTIGRWGIWLLIACLFFACKKETKVSVPGDATPPTIDLVATPLEKTTGYYTVRLSGSVKDAYGLKTIHIQCDSFYVDQTIKIAQDSLVKEYVLDRVLKAPLSRQKDSSVIFITATNVYGGEATTEIKLSDIEKPSFKTPLEDYIVEIENDKAVLNLDIALQDNSGLGAVVLKAPDLSIDDSVTISGNEFDFKKTLALPLKKGSFPLTVFVYDASGLMIQKTVMIRVSRKVPYAGDLPLYVAPAATGGDFSKYLSGMPGKVTRTGDYVYQVGYYAPEAGTEIFLLGQKSFNGYRFGQDPMGKPGDLTSSDQQSLPITLPDKGYYVIDVDTKTELYTVKKVTPDPSEAWALPDNPLAMAGAFFDDYPGASRPKGAVECMPEPGNPFRYVTKVKMHQLVSFTLTPKDPVNDKWLSPFWRYDRTLDGQLIQGSSGKNLSYTLPDPDQRYWIIITFDLHLQTCLVENAGPAN